MKKIGILTFHGANNYGAVLQSYALLKTLSTYAEVAIIDYENLNIKLSNSSRRYYEKYHNILGFLLFKILKKTFDRRTELFDIFRQKYLKVDGQHKVDRESIKTIVNMYDIFITGSDQVWNIGLTENDLTYFLDFVEDTEKKYSYAASVGNVEAINNKLYIEMLQSFKRLSVREKTTKEWLRECYKINADINIDPVFLLKKEEWENIKDKFDVKEKYLLFFVNGKPNAETYAFVKKISKSKRLKIYYMANEDRIYRYPTEKHIMHTSPCKLLDVISNADLIITDSFHITAFSIILHKDFLYDDRGNYKNRILDLFQLLGIENHCISDFISEDNLKSIDWNLIDNRISLCVEKAIRYFEYIVEDR